MLLITELRVGTDSFTGKTLPNLGELGLFSLAWAQILSLATELAFLDCAKKV